MHAHMDAPTAGPGAAFLGHWTRLHVLVMGRVVLLERGCEREASSDGLLELTLPQRSNCAFPCGPVLSHGHERCAAALLRSACTRMSSG